MEDNFEETKLNEFEDGNNQRNYFSKDDSVSNVVDATLKRVRRAFCGNRCSCGWGNCVYQKGYQGSICCSSDYAWHCC
uniref:Uncharacterized protein n=1 Tax=Panagrolaimus sp. PS1159 TaxID=55785 RepID=A0AC35G2V3_9BILA